MEVKEVAVKDIKPYERNAKKHPQKQIEQIAKSIQKFGWAQPLAIDEKNEIIIGHGRLEAAKYLKLKTVPCVTIEDLTEEEIRMLRLADNKLNESEWDDDILKLELEDLDFSDFDLDWGLDLDDDSEATEDNFDVDAELKNPAFSQTGDIWHLGRHTVICGDSTDPETFDKLLGDTKVNLVCTDAPYFVNLENKSGKIANDDLNDKEAYQFLMSAFTNFKNAMAKDASIYEFYATMKTRVFYDAFEDAGFKVGAGLIWKKPRAPFMRTDWKFNMEPIIWGWRKDGKHIWYGDQKQTAVFEFDSIKDSEKEGYSHPSSKPVQLIAYLIKQCTQTNGLVLDGFLGSASTLIACEQLGRTCYGVELEAKFVDVAVKRYIAYHDDDDSDVTVERDGQTIPYSEIERTVDING